MSSDENDNGSFEPNIAGPSTSNDSEGPDRKRPKLMRACDLCRRKKIKCDTTPHSGRSCSYCRNHSAACTFLENAPRRGPPKEYVEALERRQSILEDIINRLAPHLNLDEEAGPPITRENWDAIKSRYTSAALHHRKSTRSSTGSSLTQQPQVERESRDLQKIVDELESDMTAMYIGNCHEQRYNGNSVKMALVAAASNLKNEVEGRQPIKPTPGLDIKDTCRRRLFFWRPGPWEYLSSASIPCPSALRFPPQDLSASLIDLCFRKSLPLFPILHRASFEEAVNAKLHLDDLAFARVYLLVCAIGSRYSTDPLVALKVPREDSGKRETEWRSAGWMFFSQVMSINRPPLAPAVLTDLQIAVLASIYLEGSSQPYAPSWLLVGIGLRSALDIGAHKEAFYHSRGPMECQLWKRAFWCLVCMDRCFSAGLGRPVALNEDDIDVQLPLEVDDDFWNESTKSWNQPATKPSRVTMFKYLVSLTKLFPKAVKTAGLVQRSSCSREHQDKECLKVAELDSALTLWLDNLPDHLKWDGQITDEAFFEQAARLRILYHRVQLLLHQQFIPPLLGDRPATPLSAPSLTICKHASQSISHILGVMMTRAVDIPTYDAAVGFNAGLLLLIIAYDLKKRSAKVDVGNYLKDIKVCLEVLQNAEGRWHVAGKLHDVLNTLSSLGGISPQNNHLSRTSRKRTRSDVGNDELSGVRPSAVGTSISDSTVSTASWSPTSVLNAADYEAEQPHQPAVTLPTEASFPNPAIHPTSVADMPSFQFTTAWHQYPIGGGSQSGVMDGGPGGWLNLPEFNFGGTNVLSNVFDTTFTLDDLMAQSLDPSLGGIEPANVFSSHDWSWMDDVPSFWGSEQNLPDSI